MTLTPHQFGRQSEALAVAYLKQCGWRILATNHRTPFGEIDIIARDGDSVVFVEVKARRSQRFGSPKHALTPAKQRKLSLAALHYLKAAGHLHQRARFDLLALGNATSGPQIELIQNAFEMRSPGG